MRAVREQKQPRKAELAGRCVNRESATQVAGQPDMQHLAAPPKLGARRAGAIRSWRKAPLVSPNTNGVRMPPRDRPAGRPPVAPARHAEHKAHEHERPPRNVRVDEGLRAARFQERVVSAVAAVLGMKVVDRAVARAAPDRVRIESGRSSSAWLAPAPRSPTDLRQQPERSRVLGGRGGRERRILEQAVLRPANRPRREPIGCLRRYRARSHHERGSCSCNQELHARSVRPTYGKCSMRKRTSGREVRLAAASHRLDSGRDEAVTVLEELAADPVRDDRANCTAPPDDPSRHLIRNVAWASVLSPDAGSLTFSVDSSARRH